MITEKDILETFGNRFFSAKQVISEWNRVINEERTNHQIPPLEIPSNQGISYEEKTLSETSKSKSWYLIYLPGFSLREVLVIIGSDNKHQPRHLCGNMWWSLPEKENLWTGERKEGRYHLIKMKPFLRNMTWQEQGKAILRERKVCRASSQLIIVARLTYFLIKEEYIFPDCSHWGPELVPPDGKIACASIVTERGFFLYGWHRDQKSQNLGVFLIREFDQ